MISLSILSRNAQFLSDIRHIRVSDARNWIYWLSTKGEPFYHREGQLKIKEYQHNLKFLTPVILGWLNFYGAAKGVTYWSNLI